MELGHFDKHSPTTRERKTPPGKNIRFFRLDTYKNFILNEKLYPQITTIRAFFLQIRALYSNFRKKVGETSSLTLTPHLAATRLKELLARNSVSV